MRVLIAEDDPISRRVLEATLLKWGYEVLVTQDGLEALRALQATDAPRLGILDWMMPGMDGVEVCRRLQGTAGAGRPYLILLTAKGRAEDIAAGLEAGADDYMVKPFDRTELQARLRVGERTLALQQDLADRIARLTRADAQIAQLHRLLPICAYCKRIRADQDYWEQLERYLETQTHLQFSHGICPACWESVVQPELERERLRAVPRQSRAPVTP